ncbi:MAG: ArsR/SmtB family transcription factor [Thermoplasmatota archaeon]
MEHYDFSPGKEDLIGKTDTRLRLMHAMKDPKRKVILEKLYSGPSGGITFKKLRELTGIKPTTLAYHLKVLEENGLLSKSFRSVEGRRDYSYYTISDKGRDMIRISEKMADVGRKRRILATEEAAPMPEIIEIIPEKFAPRGLKLNKI